MSAPWLKVASVVLTAGLLIAVVAIGGGAPPDLASIASRSSEAAGNLEAANRNISRAVRDTEALVEIVSSVGEQLEASERLLETQLQIERSSRSSADRSEELTEKIRSVGARLRELRDDLSSVAGLARRAGDVTETSADSAERLQATLRRLRLRFDRLIEESRELNRKARGYEELRDGPG